MHFAAQKMVRVHVCVCMCDKIDFFFFFFQLKYFICTLGKNIYLYKEGQSKSSESKGEQV